MRFQREAAGSRAAGEACSKKIKAPSWVTRGLYSEGGGGRGLTAWDAVCWIYTSNLRSCCPELFLALFQGIRADGEKAPNRPKRIQGAIPRDRMPWRAR